MALSTRTRDGVARLSPCCFRRSWRGFTVLAQEEARESGVAVCVRLGQTCQALPILYVWWFGAAPKAERRPRQLSLGIGFDCRSAATLGLYHLWLKHSPCWRHAGRCAGQEFNMAAGLVLGHGLLHLRRALAVRGILLAGRLWHAETPLPAATAIVLSGLGFTLHHIVILGVFPGRLTPRALLLVRRRGRRHLGVVYHRSGSLAACQPHSDRRGHPRRLRYGGPAQDHSSGMGI